MIKAILIAVAVVIGMVLHASIFWSMFFVQMDKRFEIGEIEDE